MGRRVKMKTRWNGWAGMPGWARPRINETRREVDGGHWERDERKKDLRAQWSYYQNLGWEISTLRFLRHG